MPAALDVDKEQVQMLVLTYGVREAARMLGIPEGTVCDWSAKGRWVVDRPASVPLPPTMVQAVQSASPVNALQTAMKGDAIGGRAAQLKLGRRTLENLAERPIDELLTPEMSTVAKNYAGLHAQAAGYSSSDSIAKVDLRITSARSNVEAIEAEVVQDNGFVE